MQVEAYIKFVSLYSTMKMMHGPINIRYFCIIYLFHCSFFTCMFDIFVSQLLRYLSGGNGGGERHSKDSFICEKWEFKLICCVTCRILQYT